MNPSEQLSALLDGELPTQAQVTLSQHLLRDPQQRRTLARYQQVRQLLQRREIGPDTANIAGQVQQALTEEPTVIVPNTQQPATTKAPRRIWRMGIAATVALIAVMGIAPQIAPLLTNSTSTPNLAQQNTTTLPAWVQQTPAYVNHYLSEHHAYAGASHVTQPMVQTTLVTYQYAE